MWQKDDGDPPVSFCDVTFRRTIQFALVADTAEWRWALEFHSNTPRALRMVQMHGATPQQAILELRIFSQRSM